MSAWRVGRIGSLALARGGKHAAPQPADRGGVPEAAEAAFAEAVPYQYNGFKITLGKDTLVRVLNELVHSGAGELHDTEEHHRSRHRPGG